MAGKGVTCSGTPSPLVSSVSVVPGWTEEAAAAPVAGAAEVCGLWVFAWVPELVTADNAMQLLYRFPCLKSQIICGNPYSQ